MDYTEELQELTVATTVEDYFEQGLQRLLAHEKISERARNLCNETTEKLLEEIEERKDWRCLLHVPNSVLQTSASCDRFGFMMAYVLAEGDKGLYQQLREKMKERKDCDVIAAAMYKLVELGVKWSSVNATFQKDELFYKLSVIRADNVDLLRDCLKNCSLDSLSYEYMGRHLAKNCMDFFGYGDKAESYIRGAIRECNLESVRWLMSKSEETRSILIRKCFLARRDELRDFYVQIVRTGLITLTEAEWKTMEAKNPKLYKELANDV